jgi:hypothetical protein
LGNPSNHLKASCVEEERTPLLRSSVTSARVFSKKFAKSKTESTAPRVPPEILDPLLMLLSDFVFEVLLSLVLVAFFFPAFFFPTISLLLAKEFTVGPNKQARPISLFTRRAPLALQSNCFHVEEKDHGWKIFSCL